MGYLIVPPPKPPNNENLRKGYVPDRMDKRSTQISELLTKEPKTLKEFLKNIFGKKVF